MNKYIIREERVSDYKETEHMVMRAFWNIHGSGCTEHLLVRIIRNSKDYIPEISRIVTLDDKVVGAIYYTKAKVVDGNKVHDVITFGPLAIEPILQNTGIGSLLMDETFKLAKEKGYSGICIFGEPEYYPRKGFVTCDKFGITTSTGENYDAFMAYPLDEEAFSHVHGKFYESESFADCEDEEALKEINKEFPNYPLIKIQDEFTNLNGSNFGVIESINNEEYTIKYWEISIKAKLDNNVNNPKIGDIVLFKYNPKDISIITKVCKNLI